MYSKTCLKRPRKKKTKIGFQDRLSLNAGTGPRSAVGSVSGYRFVSDCNSRCRKLHPGPVPYFHGD